MEEDSENDTNYLALLREEMTEKSKNKMKGWHKGRQNSVVMDANLHWKELFELLINIAELYLLIITKQS